MRKDGIDQGRMFDWGKVSEEYAKYRDIYPPEFYEKILENGLCTAGQKVLDIGTGTGVLPRALYKHGAQFTGIDISENQISKAKALSKGMPITYLVADAERLPFPDASFDTVLMCQCFQYFDRAILFPELSRVLKPNGKAAVLFMLWLPEEDPLVKQSEQLVLKYNPHWSGNGFRRSDADVSLPKEAEEFFQLDNTEIFDAHVLFTRDSWNGRMKACRGIGASLPPQKIAEFEKEHLSLLEKTVERSFAVLHLVTMMILKKGERRKSV